MDGVAGDAHEVPAAGGDGGVAHVEDDRAAQHKEELRRLVMDVGRDPVAGVMHLQKLGAPAGFWLAEQGKSAMVIAAQPVALELLGMQNPWTHRRGQALPPCWASVWECARTVRSLRSPLRADLP